MEEKTEIQLGKRNERIIGLAFISIATAVMGGFVALILYSFVGSFLIDLLGFQFAWWQAILLGGFIGLITGIFKAFQEFRRTDAIEEQSAELGLKPLANDAVRKIEDELQSLLNREVDLMDAHFLSSDQAHIVVGDLRIESPSSQAHSNSRPSPDKVQTCVCFQFEEFDFPDFQLKPEGMTARLMDRLIGGQDIDFEDSPQFSKKYMLSAARREDAQTLFSKNVREHFERHPGLQMLGSGKQILVFRPNQLCQADGLGALIQLAMECVELVQENAVAIKPDREVGTKTKSPESKEEAIAQLEHTGGVMGAMVRNRVVTTMLDRTEVESFLDQPTPRRVPQELKKRFGFDPMLVLVPTAFLIGGLIFFVIAMFTDSFPGNQRIIALSLAAALIAVGSLILFLCFYFRNKKMRVLSRGVVVQGTLTSVSQTAWVMGNERVWQAEFVPLDSDAKESTYFRGSNVQRVRDLIESGQPTSLLRDPFDANNTLLIECYSF